MKERISKILYILFCLAFFVVPMIFPAVKNHTPGIAVITGILFAVFIGNPFVKYTSKITSQLLGAAIVGMGFGMNLIEVLKAGANGFIYTFIGISVGLGLGAFLGKKLSLNKNTTYLISVGTSICGGSAIAAAAPVLKAKASDIALASATVFTLNAIALVLFPIIGKAMGFSEVQFGYWAALGIHDTSSVVGAGMAYGQTALEVGTTVKLARALWIVPVTLFLSFFIVGKDEDNQDGEKKKVKIKVPWFIPGFIISAAIVTWIPATAEVGSFIKDISKYLMILTLFLIGANLSKANLKEMGLKPIIHGIILWLILSIGWGLAIWCNLVNCVK